MKIGQLSRHFNRVEFACRCGCGFDVSDAELIRVLEGTHGHFSKQYQAKVRIIITGGNRCVEHNETVQKEYNPDYVPYSSESPHMDGIAADFRIEVFVGKNWRMVPADEVADYLEAKYPDCYGIGRYRGRTHVDVRAGKARWDNR